MSDRSERLSAWWEGLPESSRDRARECVERGLLDPETLSSLVRAGVPVASSAHFVGESDAAGANFPVPGDVGELIRARSEAGGGS